MNQIRSLRGIFYKLARKSNQIKCKTRREHISKIPYLRTKNRICSRVLNCDQWRDEASHTTGSFATKVERFAAYPFQPLPALETATLVLGLRSTALLVHTRAPVTSTRSQDYDPNKASHTITIIASNRLDSTTANVPFWASLGGTRRMGNCSLKLESEERGFLLFVCGRAAKGIERKKRWEFRTNKRRFLRNVLSSKVETER